MAEPKKITGKEIVKQAIMYIAIMGFVILFKTIFGDKNTLIGVTTITAVLMFLQSNLTVSPGKSLLRLLAINILSVVAAYIACLNPWLSIPVNFVIVFWIAFSLFYSLKNPLYLPFILQYLFLIATPVSIGEVPLRIAASLVGPFLIMGTQLLVNKNKITKGGSKLIVSICDNLVKKIQDNSDKENLTLSIYHDATAFKKIVYEYRKDDYYITEEGRIKLDIVISLERIAKLLDEEVNNQFKDIKSGLEKALELIKEGFNKEGKVAEIKVNVESLIKEYEVHKTTDFKVLDLLDNIYSMSLSLDELRQLGKENYNNIRSHEDMPDKYKKLYEYKNDFTQKSVKFTYAFKVSLGITLAAFIASFFNLSEGRWMYFSIFSVTTPIYEMAKQKTRDRLFATAVGGLAVVVIFTIIKDQTLRMIILLLAGYFRSFTDKYRYATIFTTMSAIGTVALTGGEVVFTLERFFFVCVGVAMGLIIGKFIMPVKLTDANKELEDMYSEVVREMLIDVYEELHDKNHHIHEIDTLLIASSLIEEKLEANSNSFISDKEGEYIEKHNLLISDIYQLFTLIKVSKIKNKDMAIIMSDLNAVVAEAGNKGKSIIETVEKHILNTEDIIDKFVLLNIRSVMKRLHEANEYKVSLSS